MYVYAHIPLNPMDMYFAFLKWTKKEKSNHCIQSKSRNLVAIDPMYFIVPQTTKKKMKTNNFIQTKSDIPKQLHSRSIYRYCTADASSSPNTDISNDAADAGYLLSP